MRLKFNFHLFFNSLYCILWFFINLNFDNEFYYKMENLNFEYEFYYTMEIIKDSINLIHYLMNQLIDALSHAYTMKYKTFKQVLQDILL